MIAETSAEFCIALISATSSCSELSELMGSQPDVGWTKGDSHSLLGDNRPYRFTRWGLEERARESDDDWEAIDRLIARCSHLEPALVTLPVGVSVVFQIFLTQDNDVFGFHLSVPQCAFMARIRASIDMSIVVKLATAG